MTWASGDRLSPARLRRMIPIRRSGVADATLNVTSTLTVVSGTLVTLTTTAPGAEYYVDASFDMLQVATTANDCFGRLYVDGSLVSTPLAAFGGQVNSDRGTVAQHWSGTLAAAGVHTFQLAGNTPTASQYQILTATTTIRVVVYEVV